jgi:AraC-like DNA-binding protein
MLGANDVSSKFELLEDSLLKQFGSRLIQIPCIEYAVSQIILHPEQMSFTKMSREIGYSQKHFISMFKSVVGITPKAYLKIARFQKAIIEIEQRRTVNWTTISQDCGFYDQSHFINDFRFFSGFTPEQYLRRKTQILNYVPVG